MIVPFPDWDEGVCLSLFLLFFPLLLRVGLRSMIVPFPDWDEGVCLSLFLLFFPLLLRVGL